MSTSYNFLTYDEVAEMILAIMTNTQVQPKYGEKRKLRCQEARKIPPGYRWVRPGSYPENVNADILLGCCDIPAIEVQLNYGAPDGNTGSCIGVVVHLQHYNTLMNRLYVPKMIERVDEIRDEVYSNDEH